MQQPIDQIETSELLKRKKGMAYIMKFCAACGLCADTCFYYEKTKDPRSTPAYKMINTIGIIYRKKNRVTEKDLQKMPELLWGKCVMCRRCSCPMGIDIAAMISLGRMVCRSRGIGEDYSQGPMGISKGDDQ